MAISTAERNRRKRERKKREKEQKRLEVQKESSEALLGDDGKTDDAGGNIKGDAEIEVEYVPEPLAVTTSEPGENNINGTISITEDGKADKNGASNKEEDKGDDIEEVLRRFQMRSAVAVISDDEKDKDANQASKTNKEQDLDSDNDDDYDDELESDGPSISKRKMRELNRPTVAELKNQVARADLVEAHDVTAADPHFLIYMKSVPGTVPVPRHWGRKRKYLQGKRGIEKAPFQLPAFIVQTGITDVRSAVAEDEQNMSIKQKNRARVAPKVGAMDVDYRTLHDAFFKYQTKPKMTPFGDLYYEGKEFETQKSQHLQPGVISETLRKALGMTSEDSPPPWLMNMQRHGPPPSYPNLKIPGLNAPIPEGCSYGYHINGWGKPPLDAFGRPLYGGDPFGKPAGDGIDGLDGMGGGANGLLVTSDGKTLLKNAWGTLPSMEDMEEEEDEEESSDEEGSDEDGGDESSDEDMEQSDEEGEEKDATATAEGVSVTSGTESILPTTDGMESVVPSSSLELRKSHGGDETPMPPKQLYTVLEQTSANKEKQAGAVFTSDVTYVLPGANVNNNTVMEGAESVLSKAILDDSGKRKRASNMDDDEETDALGKKFKF